MIRKIISLFISLFIANISFSQGMYEIRGSMELYRSTKLINGEWNNSLTENDIKGSPYLNDEFINGVIFTKTKYKYVDILLRYNIYNDQIEFKTPDNKIQALSTPEIVDTIKFGDFTMIYIPYSNSKKIRKGFFQVLENGDASLFSKSEIAFKKAEKAGGYKEAEPAKFVKRPNVYYIRIGAAQAKRVENKKELISIFPNHNDEIVAFIKKNKVKTSKPAKLKELVRYYNSL